MKHEILEKIRTLLQKSVLSESEVAHLFSLLRKLIEGLSESTRQKFGLLKLYCDWALHLVVDRSMQGAEVLEKIHSVVVDHISRKDNSAMAKDLSDALSLHEVRDLIKELLREVDSGNQDEISEIQWRGVATALAEIISRCPLKFSPKRHKTFIQRIWAIPIQKKNKANETAVVEELAIIRIPKSTFFPETSSREEAYCVMLTLSETTRIIAPLILT